MGVVAVASGWFADRGPARAGWDWHAVRVVLHVVWLVLLTAVLLIGSGLAVGGAVGYGLSRLVDSGVGALPF